MTTYTAVPNSDIDPESPITTSLVTLLRDNPIAITEAASGAPSIVSAALADYPWNGTTDLSDYPWGAEDLQTATVGDYIEQDSDYLSTTQTSLTKKIEFYISKPGNYRLIVMAYRGAATGYFRIAKNGTYIEAEQTASQASPVTPHTLDINSLVLGDLIQVYARNPSDTTYVRAALATAAPLNNAINYNFSIFTPGT